MFYCIYLLYKLLENFMQKNLPLFLDQCGNEQNNSQVSVFLQDHLALTFAKCKGQVRAEDVSRIELVSKNKE